MNTTSFDFVQFQSDVDRILLSMKQPRTTDTLDPIDVIGRIPANSSCSHTTHTEIDILPIKVRSDIELLQRMLHLTHLEPKQRQELERLDVKVHSLVQWYQQKRTALRDAAACSYDGLHKLQCFFQSCAVELAHQIGTYWVVLEAQVKQQEQAECQRYVLSQKQAKLKRLLELEPDNEEWLTELTNLNSQHQCRPVHRAYLCQTYEQTLQRKVQEIITREDILPLLTLNLQGVPNDVFEISKKITPILAVLATSGTVAVPLVPALFASITLILYERYRDSRVVNRRTTEEQAASFVYQ